MKPQKTADLRRQPEDVWGIPKSGPSGSEKGVSWKRVLFRNVHFLGILENLEIPEILENFQMDNKGSRPISRDSGEFRDSRGSSIFLQ